MYVDGYERSNLFRLIGLWSNGTHAAKAALVRRAFGEHVPTLYGTKSPEDVAHFVYEDLSDEVVSRLIGALRT